MCTTCINAYASSVGASTIVYTTQAVVSVDLYLGNNLVLNLVLVKYLLWFGALLLGCNEGRVLPSYGIFKLLG